MKILGYNENHDLTCTEAKVIGFESKDNTLWFWDGTELFEIPMDKATAYELTILAYEDGKIDLRHHGIIKTVED